VTQTWQGLPNGVHGVDAALHGRRLRAPLRAVLAYADTLPYTWEQSGLLCAYFRAHLDGEGSALAQALLDVLDVDRVSPHVYRGLLMNAKYAKEQGATGLDYEAFFARVMAVTPQAYARQLWKDHHP
jgi:hypothetical protein